MSPIYVPEGDGFGSPTHFCVGERSERAIRFVTEGVWRLSNEEQEGPARVGIQPAAYAAHA